jgi:hypothetical protein
VQAVLRSFRVANHKSVRDEVELLLIPAYDRKRAVVPVAAIFGANASGKSNLLDALRWFQMAVLNSYRSWDIDSPIPRTPFRLDETAVSEASSYVVDVVLDGIQYVYGVSLDDAAVREEWLHSYPHAQKRIIFERQGQKLELGSTVSDRKGRGEVLAGLMRANALLLSVAAQAEQEEVLPVYRWFRELHSIAQHNFVRPEHIIAEQMDSTMANFPGFMDLLRIADLGISDVATVTDSPLHVPETGVVSLVKRRKRILFRHGDHRVPLGWNDQSDGTRSWIPMLVSALAALSGGTVLMTDEIDASLHPRLTARLIELFRSPETNSRGAQLLFTTHDATLLGTSLGGEVLERDEIWMVDKSDGVSSLYPLSDFHPRKGENRERRYLGGSYGAVPAVFADSLVESVLKAREAHDGAPA